MPSIFIGNATRQQRRFFYRFDFNIEGNKGQKEPPKHIDIAPGRQVRLDLLPTQADVIIRQLERAGGRSVLEKNRLDNTLLPYVYSLDRPVPPQVIEEYHDHNNEVHRARAEKRREHGAFFASQQVQETVDAAAVRFKADRNNIPKARLFEAEFEVADAGDAPMAGGAVEAGLRVQIGIGSNRSQQRG